MPRKPTSWTESAMWGGLRQLGETLGNGLTLRRLEAVNPGWPDVVALDRHSQRVTLVELKVLPHTVMPLVKKYSMDQLLRQGTWENSVAFLGAKWRIPFRDTQPSFLRGWAQDGGRAIVWCDVQHADLKDDVTWSLVYIADASPAWHKRVQQPAPPPSFLLNRPSKYAWGASVVRSILFPGR